MKSKSIREVLERKFPGIEICPGFIEGCGSIEVKNPYSGQSCKLCPEAVALYDLIKGAETLEDYKTVEDGLGLFRRYWAKEYMILLD